MQSVWLVFHDCSFHSVCSLICEGKRFVKASWWDELAVGKTMPYSDGKAMLSEPLIKIFCFNPVLFSFKVKDLYKIICFVLVKLTFTGK